MEWQANMWVVVWLQRVETFSGLPYWTSYGVSVIDFRLVVIYWVVRCLVERDDSEVTVCRPWNAACG